MATISDISATSFQRFDGKLDSILRRTLSSEVYERLSVTESCIVVTDTGKRSQRLVTLGHDAVYFSEVPPKTVQRVLDLSQVISCNSISDVPKFLPNSDQDNVLHIRLTYTTLTKTDSSRTIDRLHRSRSVSPRGPTTFQTTPNRSTTPTLTRPKSFITRRSTLSLLPLVNADPTSTSSGSSTLDLYILQAKQHTSVFVHHLHELLEDVTMHSLSEEPRQSSILYQHQSMYGHYQSLKAELLHSIDLSYERSAALLLELRQGAERYFVLKRLFWQDSEVLDYCILQLKQSSDIGNQCDRIEYCIIVGELLLTVLYQTYLVINRAKLITRDRGNTANELVRTIIGVFHRIKDTGKEANQLCQELAGILAGIIYELIRLVQQVPWILEANPSTDSVTVISLCDTVFSAAGVDTFLSRLIELVCDAIANDNLYLTLYRCVSFIEKFINHSSSGLKSLRTHFTEEFKYTISDNHSHKVISNKLSYIRTKVLQ